MTPFLTYAIILTLCMYALAIVFGMARLFIGPQAPDRILAIDFMYLVAMLIALVLGLRYVSNMYFEAALLIAVFGFFSSSAAAKFLLRGEVIE